MSWYKESEMSDNKMIACPFCNEADFDAIGLKNHLISGDCDVFEDVPAIERRVREPVKEQEQQIEFPKETWRHVSYDRR
jgi:hypothetical protein